AAAITSAVAGGTIDGRSAGDLTRGDVLDNITRYWLTHPAISSARLCWENQINLYPPAERSSPAALPGFQGVRVPPPQSGAVRAHPDLIYFHKADKGGHFAAWEQPALFSTELRAAFRSLRQPG